MPNPRSRDSVEPRRIHYIGYYGSAHPEAKDRVYSPAAAGKMEYIATLLARVGFAVELVSLSPTRQKGGAQKRTMVLNDALTVYLPFSLGSRNRLVRYIDAILIRLWLIIFLLRKVPGGSTLLVYHSLGYGAAFRLLKKLKGYKIIMEVEEIYQRVTRSSVRSQRGEWASFAAADSFIFPTVLLEDEVNLTRRPSMILHGDYSQQPDQPSRFDDGRRHVVYAGSLDRRKGATRAIAAAAYLPPDFHVHILGYGSREEREEIVELVGRVNRIGRSGRRARVSFEGMMEGAELKTFLSSCEIGLCTQDASASFNSSSFPSKILVYLSHGQRVVSCRLGAVEGSAVSDAVTFYDGDAPAAVAQAISHALEASGVDAKTLLQGLDRGAAHDMARLISETVGEQQGQDGS